MTKYVIGPDVALALAERHAVIPNQHPLLAPTLLRSQVLAQLYGDVQRGQLTRKEADRRLDHLRALRIRACSANRWSISVSGRRRMSRPKRMLARAVRCGYRALPSNTMATSRRCGGTLVTSSPPM